MVMLLLSDRTGENLKSDMAEVCLVFPCFFIKCDKLLCVSLTAALLGRYSFSVGMTHRLAGC
jgi:hypothetical protein